MKKVFDGYYEEIKTYDLPDPGIEPESLASPALAGSLPTTEPLWKPVHMTQQFC